MNSPKTRKDPVRLAIVGSRGYPYVYSGYETFVAELSRRLIARGYCVTVYCHRGLFERRPPLVDGVRLVYSPALETKVLSQLSHSLLATLHVVFSDADVVLYVNSANGPFGLFTSLARKNTIINVDGLEWLRPKWRGIGAAYFRVASYLSTRLFDVVVTDSDRMSDIYREQFDAESVTIAYGADISHSTDPGLIQRLGLLPDEYYLVVGRLIPDNNADLIIEGFVQSSSKKKLVILGDVPYRDAYAERVRQAHDHRLVFPGYVRDGALLRELYCNSYAYIHGHEFGGTNPTLLQALGCGCLILALDTAFSREVLADGEFGLFFKKDALAVSELVDYVERQSKCRAAFRARSRHRIAQKYTWDAITDQYEMLIRKLLRG